MRQSIARKTKHHKTMELSRGANPIAETTASKSRRSAKFLSESGRGHRPPRHSETKIKSTAISGKQPMLTKVFPVVLFVCNIGAAACYAFTGDWKRAVYWAASSACVGAVTF